MKLAGITAAVTATAAAGYYAYDQYTKRYPKYQEQLDMYSKVGVLVSTGQGGGFMLCKMMKVIPVQDLHHLGVSCVLMQSKLAVVPEVAVLNLQG